MARSVNYSKEEIDIIISYIENAPHLISSELGKNCPSASELIKDWENLAKFVNSCGMGIERTGTQIKNKWTDLKYRTKKKAALLKSELRKTGGGPRPKEILTDIEERILGLIGETCVSGIESLTFDSTASIIPAICEQASAHPRKCYEEIQKESYLSEMDTSFTSVQTQEEITPEIPEASPSQAHINNENNSFAVNSNTPSSWRIQNKRSINSKESPINSTNRVKKLRNNKRKSFLQREDPEEQIIQTQKKMHENLENISKTNENLLEEQRKTNVYLENIMKDQEITNGHLQLISRNMSILSQICINITGTTIAEE